MSQNPSPENLDGLIEALCKYLSENRVRFSGKQLNEAGELYERYDYSTARMVVEGKDDVNTLALVHVLTQVLHAKLSPDKAAFLIRHLNQICDRRKNQ